MKKVLGVAALVLLGACGGSDATYKVGGQELVVKDSGYVTADFFCDASAKGQLKIILVDYFPICGPNDPIDSTRNASLEHNELEMILVTAEASDPKTPVPVTAPTSCINGPAGPGQATFRHYAAGSTTPVETQAVGGQIFLTQLDPDGKKPAKGSFTLDFGTQGSITGSFNTYTCN